MSFQLSGGAIKKILNGENVHNPVLQILGCKKIPGNKDDRYRLLISDGLYGYPSALLANQMTGLILSGELEKFTVIQANNYSCAQLLPGKMVIILLELEIIASGADIRKRIGNPVPVDNVNAPISGLPDSSGTIPPCSSSVSVYPVEHQVVTPASVPTSPNATHRIVHPIICLTPYLKRWTIRARVSNKTTLHEYSNSRRQGRFFSVDFIDESGEIRATAFDECADRFFNLIEVDKVYYVSRARLRTAKRQFNSMKNDYEMNFSGETTVDLCEGDFDSIPSLQFNFISINMVDNVDKESTVDVIGVCRSASDVETVLSRKTSREMRKRDVFLVDQTKSEITLTLWGDTAENFDGGSNPVVALKGVKISDFRFRSLSAVNSTVVRINPDIREARELREWFDSDGQFVEWQPISSQSTNSSMVSRSWKTLAQARDGMQDTVSESDYYKTKATIVTAKRENCMYKSCPRESCCKKVDVSDNGKYVCVKCGSEYDSFSWRYLLNISVADFSEDQWATCFNETAELLLHKTAQELQMLRERNDDAFDEAFSEINFEAYIFDMRTKMETYNEENRLKTTVLAAHPVDPVSYSQKLLDEMKEMEQIL